MPSLAGNIFFPQVFDQVLDGKVVLISTPVHATFIAVELFALMWKAGRRADTTSPAGRQMAPTA